MKKQSKVSAADGYRPINPLPGVPSPKKDPPRSTRYEALLRGISSAYWYASRIGRPFLALLGYASGILAFGLLHYAYKGAILVTSDSRQEAEDRTLQAHKRKRGRKTLL